MQGQAQADATTSRSHYRLLAVNLGISLIIMYVAMFAMIAGWGEFVQNLNFFYMALLMWAPMSAVMLATMSSMYRNVRLNLILYGVFALIFAVSLVGIRDQLLVGDKQFVRSMIPHHSGAILMCEQGQLRDPEVKQLCASIVRSQRREIAQMKQILARL